MTKAQWFLIENEQEYEMALARYQVVKHFPKGSEEHKEKLLLVHLISAHEKATSNLPDVDPVEIIKFRMEDMGLKAADLVAVYGDKGTVSKVLNYKQPLSLTMIRKFSELLRISPELLLKEYELKGMN